MSEFKVTRESNNKSVLRIGIAGLGRASVSMLDSFVKHKGFRIAAGADLRAEARDKFAREYDSATYQDVEEMCANSEIDAVYIATPHQFHAVQAVTAANNGKHIIVEKPMALSLEECDQIIEAAEKNKVKLLVGHTHSFDSPILKIREIVRSGRLGKLGMINTWNFTDFLYRPRRKEELNTDEGGGIIFNQVPHQIDVIRLIGGGMIRSVRAMTGIWDPNRPTEGSLAAFLEFENGAAATAVYSGYDHFDTDEWHDSVAESGLKKDPDRYGEARKKLKHVTHIQEETYVKDSSAYGGAGELTYNQNTGDRFHPHFGIIVASCEKGDIRVTPKGILIYGDEEKCEIALSVSHAVPDKMNVLNEFYNAVVNNEALIHNGRWGKATMEVCLALLQSSLERKEIFLSYQVPVTD